LLELSSNALEVVKNRLKTIKSIKYYNQNILNFQSETYFDLWHDRAVFHFLTTPEEQDAYLNKLNKFLKKGGFFLLATFALEGPKQCSNLDIVNYDVEKIKTLIPKNFKLHKSMGENHPHPNGSKQKFNYFLFEKVS
jgi:ubiquinone/menaquinone biosynthesis C-methylase UbiE